MSALLLKEKGPEDEKDSAAADFISRLMSDMRAAEAAWVASNKRAALASRVASDKSGSLNRFKPSGAKLSARIGRLAHWRIDPYSITIPEDACEVHGGHATVSKGILPLSHDENNTPGWTKAVAVKKARIADDTDVERALGLAVREAEFLVELDHSNIVELEGFAEDASNGIIWLVFPWADNNNLRDFIASRDWEIAERISLIDGVVSGVEYLHSQEPPICHGDLKSLNILVNWMYRAVITDFGSAHRLVQGDIDPQVEQVESQPQSVQPLQATFCASSNTITLTGNKYTLRWAAPELLSEDRLGLWSDIWAFGWIAYEVMTNSIPFQDVSADVVVVERVIQGDLPSITDKDRLALVQELCSLMTMCWKVNPTERPTADYCRKSMNWMPMAPPKPKQVANTLGSKHRSPELLMQLGRMYERQAEYVNASNSFTEALKLCTDLGDEGGRDEALRSLAAINQLLGELTTRAAPDPEDLQFKTPSCDKTRKASALLSLAQAHRLLYEYNEALALYFRVFKICSKIGHEQGRTVALMGLAQVHWFRGEYGGTVALYWAALQVSTNFGDRQGITDALAGLAEMHKFYGRGKGAIPSYSEALQIGANGSGRQGRAETLCGLAELHRIRGEYNEASALHSEALQISTDLGDKEVRADALRGLAEWHRAIGESNEAITTYTEALQIYTDIDDRHGRADALLGLADLHRDQNRQNDAACLYEQAARVLEQIGHRKPMTDALQDATSARQLLQLQEAA